MRYCALRAKINRNLADDPPSLVEKCLSLDSELQSRVQNLPECWCYKTMTTTDTSDDIWKNKFHIYSDMFIASSWNGYRTLRMLIHALILLQITGMMKSMPNLMTPSLHAQLKESAQTIADLADDVCASAPYLLGHVDTQNGKVKALADSQKAIGGYFLLWPLFVVGRTDFRDRGWKVWAIQQLQRIGHNMGVKQGTAMAKRLQGISKDLFV
jgi:hypothetical protein